MRRFYIILILVLACQGSLTFNGKPVQLFSATASPPPPPGQPAPPPHPPRSTHPAAANAPAPDDEDDDGDDDEDEAAPAAKAPPPAMAGGPIHRKPKPSEEELYRLGMSCYAKKAAACRELALIYLPERPEGGCGTYLTNDPNGPIGIGRRVDQPACEPPTYRHMGACGVCTLPTIACSDDRGGPFGHKSSKCPAGGLCSTFGYCFPKDQFPVEHHNLPRGKECYLDRECASQECPTHGTSAFGSVGECT